VTSDHDDNKETVVSPTQPGPWWRQIFHWPLFLALAAVHMVLLPQFLSERGDDVLSIVAGVAYLALAVADLRPRRPPARPRSS
jgi:hypothetical protein